MNEDLKKIVKKIGYAQALHRMYIHKEAVGKDFYPGQVHMLDYIDENAGCTQKELASFLRVTPASIAVSVKRMEKNGLIIREEDKIDHRVMHLTISDKGKRNMESLKKAFSKVDNMMFSGFLEDEIVRLDEYLTRICENLSTEETKEKTIYEIVRQTQEISKRKDDGGA